MANGTFFTAADVDAAVPVWVLGQTVVENLFRLDDPLGKTIRVQNLPCKVVGILRAKGFSATGQDQDHVVVMPYTTVQKRITGTFWLDDVFCSAISRNAMTEATKLVYC
jgi:putative ABC transport system permease protein